MKNGKLKTILDKKYLKDSLCFIMLKYYHVLDLMHYYYHRHYYVQSKFCLLYVFTLYKKRRNP